MITLIRFVSSDHEPGLSKVEKGKRIIDIPKRETLERKKRT
jgi:hypothetical protein